MECSYSALHELLLQQKCSKIGDHKGHAVWATPEKLIIQVPIGNGVHYDIIEEITINILGMSNWDLDYWLGQHCLN
jgi:hypothetical protein